MVLSVYEADDTITRTKDNKDVSTKDILKDLAEIEEVIARRQVYLRFLQAKRKLLQSKNRSQPWRPAAPTMEQKNMSARIPLRILHAHCINNGSRR